MQADARTEPEFWGEFRHALDEKKRVTIPAAFKCAERDEFYLMLGLGERNVRVLPAKKFQAKTEELETNPSISPEDRAAFRRYFGAKSHRVALDKQRRLIVPDGLCAKAQLSGEIIVAGVIDMIELWNVERWEAALAEQMEAVDRTAKALSLS